MFAQQIHIAYNFRFCLTGLFWNCSKPDQDRLHATKEKGATGIKINNTSADICHTDHVKYPFLWQHKFSIAVFSEVLD